MYVSSWKLFHGASSIAGLGGIGFADTEWGTAGLPMNSSTGRAPCRLGMGTAGMG